MLLVAENANTDLPLLGFCNKPLLGSTHNLERISCLESEPQSVFAFLKVDYETHACNSYGNYGSYY